MVKKKIKPLEMGAFNSEIIGLKENFAYRFGYEYREDGLKAFKNRTLSAISNVVGNEISDINYYSSLIFRLIGYPFTGTNIYSFNNSELKKVLEVLNIESGKSELYRWLQILELVANKCGLPEEVSKQKWFVNDVAEALKLSGINAVLCDTASGYRFYPASETFLDKKLVIDVLNWMNQYEKAKEQYELALRQFLKGQIDRQIVDCLRLSLELFLKDYLSNNKSLENQIEQLGKLLGEKGISVEVRNMFLKLLDYYCKYNNNHAKHDNVIDETEIDFVIYLTGSFIRFLIKVRQKCEASQNENI